MKYNIDFEIAAAIFLVLFYFFHKIQFYTNTKGSRLFQKIIISLLVASITDSATALSISYAHDIPVWVNVLLNTIYFEVAPFSTYLVILYFEAVLESDKDFKILNTINLAIYFIYTFMVCSGSVLDTMFYFDENRVYQHGPLYVFLYVVPMLYTLMAIILLLRNRRGFKRYYFISCVIFILISEGGLALQMFVLDNMLVSYFFSAIAIIILLFSMETPDYQKLMFTMDELDKAKSEADEARAEAEKANRAKSIFLANMSHEIRTPINGIMGIDEIALREVEDDSMKQHLLDIRDASNSLLALINDILDVSKIESGKMEIVDGEYSLNKLMYSIMNVIYFKAESKGLQIEMSNNPQIPELLFGDEGRIRQILINLLSNAIKYTPEGKVSLYVDFEQTSSKAVNLIFKVNDTGIGIKEEDKPKIFGRFERVDLKKNRNIEGTGLGLSLTKQLTELMGGQISFESVYEEGSEFVVVLPQRVVNGTPMGEFIGRKHEADKIEIYDDFVAPDARLLVVDDVALNLKVMLGILKETKMQIDTAQDGQTCLDMAKATKYDLIFLDHLMPELDGIETLHLLKDNPKNTNYTTPVIALTANSTINARKYYMQEGFDEYLTKPMELEQLFKLIKLYLPSDKIDYKENV